MKLTFNAEKCIGCHLCELACSAIKEGVFNPRKARLKINSFFRKNKLVTTAMLCNFCLKCKEVCPVEAIKVMNGYLSVDIDSCIRCGNCSEACPNKIILLNEEGLPSICDFCQGKPHCVELCPHGALKMEVVNSENL